MPQLTIYLDQETARKLEAAAEHEKVSRSAWASDAIRKCLPSDKLPESWFALYGSWEDDRTAEEIIADIDDNVPDTEHAMFEE